jgi:hypothetical protein
MVSTWCKPVPLNQHSGDVYICAMFADVVLAYLHHLSILPS